MNKQPTYARAGTAALGGNESDANEAAERERQPPLAGGASLRLDKRTHLDRDEARYRVILRPYGNDLAEIGWSFLPNALPAKSKRGSAVQRVEHEDRAVRRARSRVRQLVLSVGADHLLTLTYRANVTEYDQACADLGRFVRLVRRKLNDWAYVAVPEQQKRGAWHWHLAVCGRQDVGLLRSAWLSVAGDGNIDVKAPRKAAAKPMLALVRYLSKYLAKGFQSSSRALNGRRFRASQGIVVPAVSIQVPINARGDVAQFALDQLKQHAGRVGHVWIADDTLAGWACSWD